MINRKVSAGGLAGGVSVILIWLLQSFVKIDVPGEVASGITTILSFITGYFVSDREDGL